VGETFYNPTCEAYTAVMFQVDVFWVDIVKCCDRTQTHFTNQRRRHPFGSQMFYHITQSPACVDYEILFILIQMGEGVRCFVGYLISCKATTWKTKTKNARITLKLL